MRKAIACGILMLVGFSFGIDESVGQDTASPDKQLINMVEQLRKSPDDTALRESIIKFAKNLTPPPPVPDEALKYEGRGQYAFKNARSAKDYLDAAEEYYKALRIAPWVPGYYSDLCTIFEKAGVYLNAKKSCEIYLLSVEGQPESADVKRRIAGLDFAIDKYSPRSLASNMSVSFDSSPPADFPSGIRYFCEADYYGTDKSGYRAEHWVALSGTAITGVTLDYKDPVMVAASVNAWLSEVSTDDPTDKTQYEGYRREGNPVVMRAFDTKRDGSKIFEDKDGGFRWVNEYYVLSDDGTKVTRFAKGIVQDYPTDCVRH